MSFRTLSHDELVSILQAVGKGRNKPALFAYTSCRSHHHQKIPQGYLVARGLAAAKRGAKELISACWAKEFGVGPIERVFAWEVPIVQRDADAIVLLHEETKETL